MFSKTKKGLESPFYAGNDVVPTLQHPDVIKHFRNIKYIKEAKGITSIVNAKENEKTKKIETFEKSFHTLNVLTNDEGEGEIYSVGFKKKNEDKMTMNMFYRGQDEQETSDMLDDIWNYLLKDKAPKEYFTFTEEKSFPVSILKALLENDKTGRYDERTAREQIIKMEKGLTSGDNPAFEFQLSKYKIVLETKIVGTFIFKIQKEGTKIDKKITIYDLASFFTKGMAKGFNDMNTTKYQLPEKLKDRVDFEKFREEYDNGINITRFKEQKSKYVLNTFGKLGWESFATYTMAKGLSGLFKQSFGYYPRTFYSIGNLTEQALGVILEKEVREKLNYSFLMENLIEVNGYEKTMKALHFAIEGNSGGFIEQMYHGYVREGRIADISSSYASIISRCLYDLENAKIEYLENVDVEEFKNLKPKFGQYVIISGMVNADKDGENHSLLVKHNAVQDAKSLRITLNDYRSVQNERKNINPTGFFFATDTYEAFEFFQNGKGNEILAIDNVVIITTDGTPHKFSRIADDWFDNRMKMKKTGKNDVIYKTLLSAMYGKTYEGYGVWGEEINEDGEKEIFFDGLKVGAYFNPIASMIITSFARIRVVEAVRIIEANGGKVIEVMTDSVIYTSNQKTAKKVEKVLDNHLTRTMYPTEYFEKNQKAIEQYEADLKADMDNLLPEEFESVLTDNYGLLNGWSEEKKMGFFEKPSKFTEGFFVELGLYEMKVKGEMVYKTMGFNIDEDEVKDLDIPVDGYFRKRFAHSINENRLFEKEMREGFNDTHGYHIDFNIYCSLGYFVSSNQGSLKSLGMMIPQMRMFSPVASMINSKKREVDMEDFFGGNKQSIGIELYKGIKKTKRYFYATPDVKMTLWDYLEISSPTPEDETRIKELEFQSLPKDTKIKVLGKILKSHGVNQKSETGITIKTYKGNQGLGVVGATAMVYELGLENDLFSII